MTALLVTAAIIAAVPLEEKIPVPTVSDVPMVAMPAPIAPPVREGEGPPVPKGNPGFWASTNDYPALALRDQREGTTGFRLSIGVDGLVQMCEIISSSGHPDLDAATCANVKRRARFYPAQDKAGKPTLGTYSNRVRWQIPTIQSYAMPSFTQSLPQGPVIEDWKSTQLTAEDYPADALSAGEQGIVGVRLDIAKDGKVLSCGVETANSSKSLNERSCAIARNWTFKPARALSGNNTEGQIGYRFNWLLPKPGNAVAVAGSNANATPRRPAFNLLDKPGSVTMTAAFDETGKMTTCAIDQTGGMKEASYPGSDPEAMCKAAMARETITPAIDKNGKAQPRKVIMKMSIEHAAPDAK